MRNFSQLLPILLLVLAAQSLGGCAYFQAATEPQCEALWDHLVVVATADAIEDNDLGAMGDVFVRGATDWLISLTGEKDKYIRRCQVEMTLADVRCLSAPTPTIAHKRHYVNSRLVP